MRNTGDLEPWLLWSLRRPSGGNAGGPGSPSRSISRGVAMVGTGVGVSSKCSWRLHHGVVASGWSDLQMLVTWGRGAASAREGGISPSGPSLRGCLLCTHSTGLSTRGLNWDGCQRREKRGCEKGGPGRPAPLGPGLEFAFGEREGGQEEVEREDGEHDCPGRQP